MTLSYFLEVHIWNNVSGLHICTNRAETAGADQGFILYSVYQLHSLKRRLHKNILKVLQQAVLVMKADDLP